MGHYLERLLSPDLLAKCCALVALYHRTYPGALDADTVRRVLAGNGIGASDDMIAEILAAHAPAPPRSDSTSSEGRAPKRRKTPKRKVKTDG